MIEIVGESYTGFVFCLVLIAFTIIFSYLFFSFIGRIDIVLSLLYKFFLLRFTNLISVLETENLQFK